MNLPIYYFTVEGISSSVFDSQVYAYVKKLRHEGIATHLIIGQRYKAKINPGKLLRLKREKDTQFLFLPQYLAYANQASRLKKRLPKNAPLLLHCRNIEAAYIGWLVKKQLPQVKLLYDVRGYVEDEMRYFKRPQRAQVFQEIHRGLFNAPIGFSFVSERLRQVYQEEYQVRFHTYAINPSAYNDNAFRFPSPPEKRDQSSPTKVVFVGGTQSYQKIDQLAELCQPKKELQLTVITHRKPKGTLKNGQFFHGLTTAEVAARLDNMDYGILYRQKEAFNEVATPTKIAEYWSKGLPVIGITSAGAYTPIIKKNPFLGEVFADEEAFKKAPSFAKIDWEQKKKITDFAKENYSLSANFNRYLALYKSLEKQNS